MESPRIPIQNLYYLLCYSWDQLHQGDLVDVSRVPSTELVDLFALVLCDGIKHLARRGLEQGYELHIEELAGVRGRIDMLGTARRFLTVCGRAKCSFDELTANTVANRILKSTLRVLGTISTLDSGLRRHVKLLYRDLHDIEELAITRHTFRQVQLHSNNRFYRFLLNVCELVHRSWLVDEQTGVHRFREFVRDERAMAKVFENFVFNFLRRELLGWDVRREHIAWRAESESDPDLLLLPTMRTDVSLRRGDRHLIIDAKYYQTTLAQYYDTRKVHSGNLYQLLSYLSNAERQPNAKLCGMLLYPRVDRTLRERYEIQGFEVTVCTLDLDKDWRQVKHELLDLVQSSDAFLKVAMGTT